MKFYKSLYVSESLKKQKRQIAWKLKTRIFMPSIYIITIADNSNLLDIYHSAILKQPYFRNNNLFVVGFCTSQSEATDIVQDILKDVLKKYGNLDVKKYFLGENI